MVNVLYQPNLFIKFLSVHRRTLV